MGIGAVQTQTQKRILITALAAASFYLFIGCANKNFEPAGGSIPSSSSSDGNLFGGGGSNDGSGTGSLGTNGTGGTGSGGGGGTGSGGNTGTGGTGSGGTGGGGGGGSSSSLPKMSLSEPPCPPNSLCPAYFTLAQPAAMQLDMQWRTDDTKYQQNAAQFGTPNQHYVPTQGSTSFAPGQSQRQILIQSLNIAPPLVIPFIFFNCKYGGIPVSCADLL